MIKKQWIGLITIGRREMIRVFRIWPQTLIPSVITATLYFLIFGNFIGSRIGEIDSVAYIEFIVPGLIMMAVITTSYANVVSSVFSTKFQRSIEEMLIAPMQHVVILLGFVSGGIIRSFIVGIFVTIVSLFFTDIKIMSLSIVLFTIILTGMVFSLFGFINALLAKTFDDISIIPTFVLTPLTYLGGVFYSIKMLPPVWQKVSLANPILYLVNIFRYGFLGISDINVTLSLIWLVIFVILLWVFCIALLKKGIGLQP